MSSPMASTGIPKLLDEAYNKDPNKRRIAQRLFRPYPGISWEQEPSTTPDEDEARKKKLDAASANVSGLDVLLVLIRQLLSFDLELPSDANHAEKFLVDAGNRDIGWDMEEDWRLKVALLKQIFPDRTTNGTLYPEPMTLQRLLDQPSLRSLFTRGPFATVGSHGYLFPGKMDEKTKQFSKTGMSMLVRIDENQINEQEESWMADRPFVDYFATRLRPRYDVQTITDIPEGFVGPDGITQFLPTCANPAFIRAYYLPDEGSRLLFPHLACPKPFSIPTLQSNGDHDGKLECGYPEVQYQLLAAIRLASEGVNDDIRLYRNNGSYLQPGKQGNRSTKDAESTGWRLSQPGSYMLFYGRVPASRTGLLAKPLEFPLASTPNSTEMPQEGSVRTAWKPESIIRGVEPSSDLLPGVAAKQQDMNRSRQRHGDSGIRQGRRSPSEKGHSPTRCFQDPHYQSQQGFPGFQKVKHGGGAMADDQLAMSSSHNSGFISGQQQGTRPHPPPQSPRQLFHTGDDCNQRDENVMPSRSGNTSTSRPSGKANVPGASHNRPTHGQYDSEGKGPLGSTSKRSTDKRYDTYRPTYPDRPRHSGESEDIGSMLPQGTTHERARESHNSSYAPSRRNRGSSSSPRSPRSPHKRQKT